MRFPIEKNGKHLGVFILSRDSFGSSKLTSRTLRRIESLRRTITSTLMNIEKANAQDPQTAQIDAD